MKKTILNTIIKDVFRRIEYHPDAKSGRFLHYAYLVQNNKIIDSTTNAKMQSPPLHWGYDNEYQNLHAEVRLYMKCKGYKEFDIDKKFEVINIRINKAGLQFRNAAPCPRCEELMRIFGCKSIYYTSGFGLDFGEIKL